MSTIKRKLATVYTPQSQQGFLGKGHTARPVVAVEYSQSDPFIMLMDDWLDKKDHAPVGGPHPHAGFETVTLVLQGEIGDGLHALKSGDFELMTAGSGVVHTETIDKPMKMRILQLWLNLPQTERQAMPRVQRLKAEHVPYTKKEGAEIKVYSGHFAGVSSPVKNHTPLIVAEITMKPNASLTASLPADYSTFFYMMGGSIHTDEDDQPLATDQVGWLDRHDGGGESEIQLTAGDEGAYFVLYAAEPQRHEIVSHGPFIADTMEKIRALYAEYRAGKMGHITDVPAERQLVY